MADLAVMELPINRNVHIPPELVSLGERLPAEWKEQYGVLVARAVNLYQKLTAYSKTIESICHLEDSLNANNLPDPTTLDSVKDVICKNVPENIKKFFCLDRAKCEKTYEQSWIDAKENILSELEKAKTEAANNCVKTQANLSAVLILAELLAIYSVWKDIQNAENIIETCKERDIPLIQARIEDLKGDESVLKKLIDDNLKGGNPELLKSLQARSFSLIRKVNYTRNLISDVKYQINGKVARIGQSQEDHLRSGVSNAAHTVAGIFQYSRLEANMSSPFRWLQAAVTATFGILTVSNVVAYQMCEKKLAELREIMLSVRDMERFVDDLQEVMSQAESIYLNNNN